MNSFKRMFQRSNDDQTASLKHSKSMPYESSSQGRPPRADPSKHAYCGKTPLKKSDIVYVEQAPGMLEIYHGKLSQHTYYHGPTRANSDARADLLAKFPYSPEPTEGLPRSGFRALSLNSKNQRSQVPIHNSGASGRQACPSIPRRKQRHEAPVDQASADVLQTPDDHTHSGRLAERIHAKSSTSRSNITPPPAPALLTPRSLHPVLSRSAHSSRINIREVPSRLAVPTPAPVQSYWPYSKYDEISHEQDPTVLRGMINRYPLAPVRSQRCPEHMRPIHFDMDESHGLEKTLQWYIHLALAQGRPLDVRAGGRYRRIVDASDPMGIVPETGADWSQQGANHR
ncbi:uncharacterized protein BJ212DRAFT_1379700 [Suillus subaureus]|uniref:Uncharacterized protein n=1 Tax=Suillus subaureus TaxID=48587 RepID=A0A9P7J9A5_9AGAM|nr:uncharacterized protein BJ212DRAFT_1379700 [Suillus subaureus]KAG1809381.1 hypothetical protein BJ212DRAFT_1379700 [Suillus subaureus]